MIKLIDRNWRKILMYLIIFMLFAEVAILLLQYSSFLFYVALLQLILNPNYLVFIILNYMKSQVILYVLIFSSALYIWYGVFIISLASSSPKLDSTDILLCINGILHITFSLTVFYIVYHFLRKNSKLGFD